MLTFIRALHSRSQRFTRMFVMIFQDTLNSLDDRQRRRALNGQRVEWTRLRITLLPWM